MKFIISHYIFFIKNKNSFEWKGIENVIIRYLFEKFYNKKSNKVDK
jgi:hypothetical protein